MPTRVAVDDDEQQIQDLIKEMRRLRSRLATTAVKGTHDEFTAAATPATTYTLTYIPLTGTCLMALNGHVQREGTDYTCDYDTGIVTVSATQAAGDKLTFRYLVTDWLIARSVPPDIGSFSDAFNRANSTTTLGSPWQTFATGDSTLNGWNNSTWGINTNRAYIVTQPTDGLGDVSTGIAYVDTGSADGQLDLDIVTVPTAFDEIAAFRCDPAPGGVIANRSAYVVTTSSLIWIAPTAFGAVVGGGFTSAFTSGDHLTVVLSGGTVTIKRNGSTVFTNAVPNNLTKTKHGLGASDPAGRFDNFAWVGA